MSGYTIRWDVENQHHIFVEHAERNITRSEVEQVVLSSNSVRWFTKRGGRSIAQGRTLAGKCLRVVYSGLYDVRPVAAYRRPKEECEQWK